VKYWLKAFGSAARPLRDDWTLEANGILRSHATFALRPGLETGDRIVYYAAGARVVFAAGEVTSEPYLDRTHSRDWPWRIDVALDATKPFIHNGVRLANLNVPSSKNDVCVRIKRRSHVQLSQEEYAAAVAALTK